jgi:hypothetical protein
MKTYKNFIKFLVEAYIDDLKSSKRFTTIPQDIIQHYHDNAASDKVKRDTEWILGQHTRGNITPDMASGVKEILNNFHKNKHLLPFAERELKNHKDINSIGDAFQKAADVRSNISLQKRIENAPQEIKDEASVIHNSGALKVQRVDSQRASCHYGSGTKWCVSARDEGNMYPEYTSYGNFYIAHGRDESGKPHRYGIHFEGLRGEGYGSSPEFRNEADESIDPYKLVQMNPDLKRVHAFQFKHGVFTTDENNEKANKAVDDIEKNPQKLPHYLTNKSEHPNFRSLLFKTFKYDVPEDIAQGIASDKGEDTDLRADVIRSGKLKSNSSFNHKTALDPSEPLRVRVAALHPRNSIGGEISGKILEDKTQTPSLRIAALKNMVDKDSDTDAPGDHIVHKIMADKSDDSMLRANVIARHFGAEHAPQSTINSIVNDTKDSPTVRAVTIRTLEDRVQPSDLHAILNNPKDHEDVRKAASYISMKSMDKENAQKFIHDENEDPNIRLRALHHHGEDIEDKTYKNILTSTFSSPKLEDDSASLYEYNDRLASNHIHQLLINKKVSKYTKENLIKHKNFDVSLLQPHHIDEFIDGKSLYIREAIAKHPNLQQHHIDKLVNDKDLDVRSVIAKHPNLQQHHIDKLVDDKDLGVRSVIAERSDLQQHHIDKLVGDNKYYVRSVIAKNPKLQPHHIDKLVDDNDRGVKIAIAAHSKLQPHHIDKLVDDNDRGVKIAIAAHSKLQQHHIDKLVDDDSSLVKAAIAAHSKLQPHHIDKLVDDEYGNVKAAIAAHSKLQQHHIDKLVDDKDLGVRGVIAERSDLQQHHIDKLVDDNNYYVRSVIAKNPKLQPHHIDKLVDDDNTDVRLAIRQHPLYKKLYGNQ